MQTTAKRLAANTLWLTLGRFSRSALNLLLTIILARQLGEAGFGRYAFITSVGFMGNVASTFGMDTFVIRSVARDEAETNIDVTSALLIQLFISIVFVVGVWFAVGMGWFSAEISTPIAIYILILLPLAFGTIYSAILRGVERMEAHLAYTLITASIQLIGIWLLTQRSQSLSAICAIILLANLVGTLSAWLFSRRIAPAVHFIAQIPRPALRNALSSGWILALIMIGSIGAAQLGVFTLKTLATDADVGLFSAAAKLADAGRILPGALFGALFPSMARNQHKNPRYRQLFWSLVGLFLGVAIVGQWLAAPIITLLFNEYEQSIPVLQILLFGLPIFLFRLRYSFELIGRGHERRVLIATVVMLVLSVPIFYFCVDGAALVGAAWATIVSLGLHSLLLWAGSQRP